MNRFTKRPGTIEAVRFPAEGEPASETPTWWSAAIHRGDITRTEQPLCLNISTSEGVMRADPGDWIIRGVKGELYPCKPDIFEKTYVEASEPNQWALKGEWAPEDGADWDAATGAPKLSYMANAVQVWSILQNRRITVAMAAEAFNVPPATIRAAVDEHYWMMLVGPDDQPDQQTIEHDGE